MFQALNVRCSTDPESYLGLSNVVGLSKVVGRKKKMAFQKLKDRLQQKITGVLGIFHKEVERFLSRLSYSLFPRIRWLVSFYRNRFVWNWKIL